MDKFLLYSSNRQQNYLGGLNLRSMTDLRKPCPQFLLGIVLLGIFGIQQASACRYSVRDVGFIDLGSDPYRLYCYIRADTPQDVAGMLQDIPAAALLDSNIKSRTVNVDLETDHPALEYVVKLNIETFPAAVLVSPEGMSLRLPLPDKVEEFKEAFWTRLDEILLSPLRETILKAVIDSHSVVLLVEGTNSDKNADVRSLLEEVTGKISKGLQYLPKAIEKGPEIVTLPVTDHENEGVLLWSLGLGEKPTSEPSVAVLYGRARKIGEVLHGKTIQKSVIHNTLMIVGQSCECGLDRRWMQGTMLPLVWDQKVQARATERLGFDAESPMVKMEVSRILDKGSQSTFEEEEDGLDAILFGYTEQFIDIGNEEIPSEPEEPSESEPVTEESDSVESSSAEEEDSLSEVEEVLAAQSGVGDASEEAEEEKQESSNAAGSSQAGQIEARNVVAKQSNNSSPIATSNQTKAYAFGILALLIVVVGLLILARGQRQAL